MWLRRIDSCARRGGKDAFRAWASLRHVNSTPLRYAAAVGETANLHEIGLRLAELLLELLDFLSVRGGDGGADVRHNEVGGSAPRRRRDGPTEGLQWCGSRAMFALRSVSSKYSLLYVYWGPRRPAIFSIICWGRRGDGDTGSFRASRGIRAATPLVSPPGSTADCRRLRMHPLGLTRALRQAAKNLVQQGRTLGQLLQRPLMPASHLCVHGRVVRVLHLISGHPERLQSEGWCGFLPDEKKPLQLRMPRVQCSIRLRATNGARRRQFETERCVPRAYT